ncbi:MAG TPA: cation diffusion facilitator family transporter [Phycisphaerae bacterium]|nr:cation diffusion facilitator family transporter [Phycisphaerae bacterium]
MAGGWIKTAKGVTWVSLVVNMVLAGAKVLAGIVFRSQTILADGLHSASDLVTDLAVLAGVRASSKPADMDHHYGHRRISTLVGLFIGASLAGAAAWIVYDSVNAFHGYLHGRFSGMTRATVPFWLAIVSIPAKELMFRLTRSVGRKTSDVSVIANAWHHRTDAFTSVAAAVGLGGVLMGGHDWRFLDPLTATALATLLLLAAVRIVSSSASELIDRAPSRAELACIEQALAETRGVHSYHAFRARQIGGKVAMDVHVLVDPELTVREGHDIATAVEQKIQRASPHVIGVIVHVEPAGEG